MAFQNIFTQYKKRVFALCAMTLFILFPAILFIFDDTGITTSQDTVSSVAQEATTITAGHTSTSGLISSPDILSIISVIFDKDNSLLIYTSDIATDDTGVEIVVENSSFMVPSGTYDFRLSSRKSPEGDSVYTTEFLRLTVTETTDKGTVEISYFDKDVDGILDAAYVNGSLVNDDELVQKEQEQYTAELVYARNHLLGLDN